MQYNGSFYTRLVSYSRGSKWQGYYPSPILKWMWSGVNYHEVHHKFPYLSHSYLRLTFQVTRETLPYVVTNGYLRNLWQHLHRDYYAVETPRSDLPSN